MDLLEIKVKRLSQDAVIPTQIDSHIPAFNVTAIGMKQDYVKEVVTYDTGLAFSVPHGYIGLVFPKKDIYKVQLVLSDAVAVIKPGDEKELKLTFRVIKPHIRRYGIGDVIAEVIFIKTPEAFFVEQNF